jgi:hypothetical protein
MKRSLMLIALCALPNFVWADADGYTYVRAGYTKEFVKSHLFNDVELPGRTLDFSYALDEDWALIANHYATDEGRTMIFNQTLGLYVPKRFSHEFTSLGALYHARVKDRVDLMAAVEYAAWEYWFLDGFFGNPSTNDDERGYRISAGLKAGPFGGFEGILRFRQFTFLNPGGFRPTEDTIADTVVEGNYYFMQRFSFGGSFIRNDHSERFTVTLGYTF